MKHLPRPEMGWENTSAAEEVVLEEVFAKEEDLTPTEESVADEWRACLWDRITFGWVHPLISLGVERPLEHEDLGRLPSWDRVSPHLKAFSEARRACEGEVS